MIISSDSLSRGSGMPYQVHDALPHAISGTELSRVRTELRLLPPEAYQQKSDCVERGRHCNAIKSVPAPIHPKQHTFSVGCQPTSHLLDVVNTTILAGWHSLRLVREPRVPHPSVLRVRSLTLHSFPCTYALSCDR